MRIIRNRKSDYLLKKIYLDDLFLNYQIKLSRKSKSISIKIIEDYVLLTIPLKVPIEYAENFLLSKFNWCYSKVLLNSNLKNKSKFFVNGFPGVLFLGEQHGITFQIVSCASQEGVSVKERLIYINTTCLEVEKCCNILKSFFVERLRKEIIKMVFSIENTLKVKHKKIYIKDQNTRWGSCSSKNNLSFNWRLILAPAFVLDYVVYHEVLHLKIPNHSAQFWSELKELCPKTEEAKKWLKSYKFCLRVLLEDLVESSINIYGNNNTKF